MTACISCKAKLERDPKALVAAGAKKLCSVRNGLEFLWLCADCAAKVGAAMAPVVALLPTDEIQYLHLNDLVRLVPRPIP